MTLVLKLTPELEGLLSAAAALSGTTPDRYALKLLNEKLDGDKRRQDAIAMLKSWREEGDAEEERKAYEELTQAIDEDRTSCRKLFPPELKGISW